MSGTAAGRPAVVLFSGGLDSTTLLAYALHHGWDAYALTFRYGQRHDVEVARATAIAAALPVRRHVVADVDLRAFGGSALTDPRIAVPKDRAVAHMAAGVPVTYVPARNTIFLSFALAWAETLGATDLFIGVNAVDYSGYPDCRPEFVAAFEHLAGLATATGVHGTRFHIHAPLQHMTKADIIRAGVRLGLDYGLTHSCYDPSPDGAACARCDACQLRRKGFEAAGVADPTRYAAD